MSEFKKRIEFVRLWKIRSDELYEAAKVVWDTDVVAGGVSENEKVHMLYRPATLLMGLSLETLLKGLIIEKEIVIIEGDQLPNPLRTHNLLNLLGLANIALHVQTEIESIKRLTAAIEWTAKYPGPVTEKKLQDALDILVRVNDDFERFEEIRKKVLIEFTK